MYEYKIVIWTEHIADIQNFINTESARGWRVHTFSKDNELPYTTATILFERRSKDIYE